MLNVYPVITYDKQKMIDISKRFAITNIDSDKSRSIYLWHTIRGWKSPENVAYDYYGSCDYVWVILALNNIVHPTKDWLMSDDELRDYIEKKYESKMHNIHHYEKNGIFYPVPLEDDVDGKTYIASIKAIPITNYEYEVDKNEKKRRIKVLRPELLSTIEHEVRALFK